MSEYFLKFVKSHEPKFTRDGTRFYFCPNVSCGSCVLEPDCESIGRHIVPYLSVGELSNLKKFNPEYFI